MSRLSVEHIHYDKSERKEEEKSSNRGIVSRVILKRALIACFARLIFLRNKKSHLMYI